MSEFDLTITEQTEEKLIVLIRWTKITMYFGILLIFIIFNFAMLIIFLGEDGKRTNTDIELPTLMLILVGCMLPSCVYSFKASKNLKEAIQSTFQSSLDSGLFYLACFFKYSILSLLAFFFISYLVITNI